MRRIAVAAVLTGAAVLAARALTPKLHARMVAACERMFEQMPDGFPPKRMLHGIEETRANTERILELLDDRRRAQEPVALDTPPTRTDDVEVVVA